MKEREISLVDLLVEILLRWRMILVFMLIGGVLLGAFGYMRSYRSTQAQASKVSELKGQLEQEGLLDGKYDQEILEAAIDEWINSGQADFQAALKMEEEEEEKSLGDAVKEWLSGWDVDLEQLFREWAEDDRISLEDAVMLWLEEELTPAQKSSVDYAIYYEDIYNTRKAYRNQSVYMQLDANDTQRADITFLVSSDDLERTYNIERVYEDVINSAELEERIAEKAGVPVTAVSDIYYIARGSGGLEKGSDSLRVTVMHYDEKMCRELAEVIIGYVEEKHDELEAELGEHSAIVLNQSFGAIGSGSVLSTQRNFDADLLSVENAFVSRKAEFTDAAWYYYNLLTTGKLAGNPNAEPLEEEEEEEEAEEGIGDIDSVIKSKISVPSAGISLKYIILGMVMAAFCYAFVIFMLYVLDNKLRPTDQLQELYGMPQLGQIPGEKKARKLFGFVDEWILALRYYGQRKFTAQEALNLAKVAVKMAAGKEGLDSVCIIGCGLKAQSMKTCEQIKAFLEAEKLGAQILNNVLYDAEAMERLGSAQGVVLVEKAGSTLYTEVAQELELLKRQDIKVLGGILVE